MAQLKQWRDECDDEPCYDYRQQRRGAEQRERHDEHAPNHVAKHFEPHLLELSQPFVNNQLLSGIHVLDFTLLRQGGKANRPQTADVSGLGHRMRTDSPCLLASARPYGECLNQRRIGKREARKNARRIRPDRQRVIFARANNRKS